MASNISPDNRTQSVNSILCHITTVSYFQTGIKYMPYQSRCTQTST